MLSIIIIAKNEQELIGGCLESIQGLAGEILVVDSGSTDDTNTIAKKYGAKIVEAQPNSGYDNYRNVGLSKAKGDWIFYLDADERLTPELAREISSIADRPDIGVYQIRRKNIYLGHEMRFGGWGDELIIRLFHRSCFSGYSGKLHEQPIFNCKLSTTQNFMIHFSHRDLESMLNKTISFTDYEARLRWQALHPPVVAWRIVRVMLTEFWHRFIRLQAARDGVAGVIDGLFQVFNTFIIYARLWEIQNEKSLSS